MTDPVAHRRRASDRAEERLNRAARLGDHAGVVMAKAQLVAARRQRAVWAERHRHSANHSTG